MRAVVFTGAGDNSVVAVHERPAPEPGPEEVCVEVSFAGLNPADLLQREGKYPAPHGSPADVPGLEVSGVVRSVGARVSSVAAGERVFGLVGGGGLAELVVAHERCVVPVPENLDDREAAATPEAFITAHDAVFSQARLESGESILVTGASGGVGTAAVQLATVAGAQVFGAVRSETAADLVTGLGGTPVDVAEIAAALKAATRGAGVDVVVELVGGSLLPDGLASLAQLGRVVVVSTASGDGIALSLRHLMGRRASIRGTVLRSRPLEEKALAVQAFGREVVPHLRSGRVRPLIDSEFPVDTVQQAFDRLSEPGKAGRILVAF